MKVSVDISPLISGHKSRGIGRYTGLILTAFRKLESPHEFIEHSESIVSDADLTFYPYFDPFFLTLPLVRSGPVVVTVHDLIPLTYPEHFRPGIRGTVKWQLQKRALKSADAVITDSDASKADIVRFTDVSPEKVTVVRLAPTMNFSDGTVTAAADLRQRFGLPGKFILYVGDVNYNKNIPNLLRAFSQEIAKDPGLRLVLVGRAFTDTGIAETRDILALADVLGVTNNLVLTGFTDESDLKQFYLSADCFILPSLAEGFGLPLIDALSVGCICITSNRSSLIEIAGPSIKVDPESPEEIASGIIRAFGLSQSARKRMAREAIRWASGFTWEKTAAGTVRVFESLVQKP